MAFFSSWYRVAERWPETRPEILRILREAAFLVSVTRSGADTGRSL